MTESKAYLQVEKMTSSKSDIVRHMAMTMLDESTTMEEMVRIWHLAMGAPVRDTASVIPVEDVNRRLRLILEEYSETVKAAGFKFVSKTTGHDLTGDITLAPVEGAQQDLVEIADGLADINVVTIGSSVEWGLPHRKVFREVMWSNSTKLPVDGCAIVNRCITGDEDLNHSCETDSVDCVLLDPEAPLNKILKPSTYIKADVPSVLFGSPEPEKPGQSEVLLNA